VKLTSVAHYRSPGDGSPLAYEGPDPVDGECVTGALVSPAGDRFPIEAGVPNLLHPPTLSPIEEQTRQEYDRVAEKIYDAAVDWQFAAFHTDEEATREGMIDMLGLGPDMRVLEIGCGTGRDSFRLARRLGAAGELHLQDLSPRMVHACVAKMREHDAAMRFACGLEYSASNVTWLPYPDGHFDAVFHFGGFNQFGDLKRGAAELARVVRLGGRVLVGDEAVAPWLEDTEFAGIVTTNNALFKAELPLRALPVGARDVTVRWIVANCFYVIAFTKGDGPPPLDLDLPHAGWRGGTLRSRYFGVMEGVTPEAKAMAREAAARAGISVHAWLDGLVRREAGAPPAPGPR